MSTELNTHLKKFLRTELNYCLFGLNRVLLTQLEPPEQLSARLTDKGSFFDVVI